MTWVWILLGGAIGGILVALLWAAVTVGRYEDEARARWIDDELRQRREQRDDS